MDTSEREALLAAVKQRVQDLPLGKLSDEELREEIEGLIDQSLQGRYLGLDDRVFLARQDVYKRQGGR